MVLKVFVYVVEMIGSAGSAGRRLGVGCATREVKVVQWDLRHFWASSNGSKCFQTETCLFCAAACLEPYDIVLAVCWMVTGAGIARESWRVGPHKHVEAHSLRQDMAVITAS